MNVTLTISEKTYQSLENQAQKRELESVEQFLEELTEQFENEEAASRKNESKKRREVVDGILEFQSKMKEKYGIMEDSTEMLREDRMRG